MTSEVKINFCRTQFVYNRFLGDYYSLLKKLHEDKSFMRKIREISENTAEPLLFGVGIDDSVEKSARFQRFKDDFCDIFFRDLKFADYPEYKEIYYSIKKKGYSGKSATISVFYAMVFFDIEATVRANAQMKKTSLLQKLFPNTGEWREKAVEPSMAMRDTVSVNKPTYSNALLRKEFEDYLVNQGYKKYTPSGNPSTVYAYIKGIDFVCAEEYLDWAELAQNISEVIPRYDWGGTKETQGNKSHRTIINALIRYKRFLKCR